MINVSTKTPTKAVPGFRPIQSSEKVIKAKPRPLKSKRATQAKAKNMTDFDFVGIAG